MYLFGDRNFSSPEFYSWKRYFFIERWNLLCQVFCEVHFVAGCDVNKVNKKGEHPLFSAILSRVDIKVRIRLRP